MGIRRTKHTTTTANKKPCSVVRVRYIVVAHLTNELDWTERSHLSQLKAKSRHLPFYIENSCRANAVIINIIYADKYSKWTTRIHLLNESIFSLSFSLVRHWIYEQLFCMCRVSVSYFCERAMRYSIRGREQLAYIALASLDVWGSSLQPHATRPQSRYLTRQTRETTRKPNRFAYR